MKAVKISFTNLRTEMEHGKITVKEIAHAIGRTRSTAGLKLARKAPLSIDEAAHIRQTFFPHKDIEYLFAEAFADPKI